MRSLFLLLCLGCGLGMSDSTFGQDKKADTVVEIPVLPAKRDTSNLFVQYMGREFRLDAVRPAPKEGPHAFLTPVEPVTKAFQPESAMVSIKGYLYSIKLHKSDRARDPLFQLTFLGKVEENSAPKAPQLLPPPTQVMPKEMPKKVDSLPLPMPQKAQTSPTVPTIPSVPSLPALPSGPTLPSVPSYSAPGVPQLTPAPVPTIFVPSVPTLPVVPPVPTVSPPAKTTSVLPPSPTPFVGLLEPVIPGTGETLKEYNERRERERGQVPSSDGPLPSERGPGPRVIPWNSLTTSFLKK